VTLWVIKLRYFLIGLGAGCVMTALVLR